MSRNRLLRHRVGSTFSTGSTTGAFTSAPLPTSLFTSKWTMAGPGYVGSKLAAPTITGAGGTNSTDTDWGAVGDGVTDDTTALRNALTWLGGSTHRVLNFGTAKTYIVNATSGACLSMTGKTFFQINGNSSTIKQKNGMSVYFGAFGFDLITCTDAYINGLTFDGNRSNRTPVEQEGHPCALHDCDRIAFSSCTFKNSSGSDGMMLSGISSNETDTTKFCTDILMQSCSYDNNYRGGLFIRNAYNVQCLGGSATNTNGTNPEFGIGIEPNAGSGGGSDACRDILIAGVTFSGNNGINTYCAPTVLARRVTWMGNRINAGGVNNWTTATSISWGSYDGRIVGNTFEGISSASRGAINIQGGFNSNDASGMVIEGNSFNTINVGTAVIYVHSASGTGNIIRNNTGFALSDTFVANFGTASTSNNVTVGARTDPAPGVPPWPV